MSFCSFSKELNENFSIQLDNRFITKYLPEANELQIKVYLYGLYLCRQTEVKFTLQEMAEVFHRTKEEITAAFLFWQEYDLVEISSFPEFSVRYLPITSSVGRPKKVHYERYSDFNKELTSLMQSVGKYLTYNDQIKYMHFLEEYDLQPNALLLIIAYCVKKQGAAISHAYIFNKAKKLLSAGIRTYEQTERELSSYNQNEPYVAAILSALSLSRKVDENDYVFYTRWTEKNGFTQETILYVAKYLKKGSLETLDVLLDELYQKGKTAKADVVEYLSIRDTLVQLTFKVGRKLGVKVGNPAPYIEEYTEKWFNYGFEEAALCDIATYAMRLGKTDFNALHEMVQDLFKEGIITKESVAEYLVKKTSELKLFTRIQSHCGALKKSEYNLSLIETWHSWNFSDEMIIEAAKRSATSNAPIPYMNKILSDWKRAEIFDKKSIPEREEKVQPRFENPSVQALNDKTDRERFYALLREKALSLAEKNLKKANTNPAFKEVCSALSTMEISLAKAEMFTPEKLPLLEEEKKALLQKKATLLKDMGMTEEMILPQYACKKCNDTGFMKNGKGCDCYPQGKKE